MLLKYSADGATKVSSPHRNSEHVRQQKAMNENASHQHTTSKMRNNIL